MRQVTKDDFYKVMGPLDVCPEIVTSQWPYTSEWRLRYQRVMIGKITGHKDGSFEVKTYYLTEEVFIAHSLKEMPRENAHSRKSSAITS